LITGASRGIGKAIALRAARDGANIVVAAKTSEPHPKLPGTVHSAVAEIEQAGGQGLACVMDLRDEQQIRDTVEQAERRFGGLDILVNNAGVNTIKHRVTTEQFPIEEWNRIVNVDLTGVYIVSKAAARFMVARKAGRIINISSIAGLVALRLQSPYVAAKHGVIGLTRAMAIELGPQGVLVNAIAPGSTLTDGTKQLFYGEDGKFRESVQRLLDHIPLGRPGSVEEIAHAALFLAAPESSYITGTVITVDGGWTAGGFARDF